MISTTYLVEGMTCEHCVKAVTEEISKIPGVARVAVDLVPEKISTVRIDSPEPVDAAAVSEAIDEAGYSIAEQ
jgi:copper chaperone CopZ